MSPWEKTLLKRPKLAYLAAAAITLLFIFPIAGYVSYYQARQNGEQVRHLNLHADRHINLIKSAISQANAGTRLIASTLPVRNTEQLQQLSENLLQLIPASRVEVSRGGESIFILERKSNSSAPLSSQLAMPANLQPLGDPSANIIGKQIVLTQPLGNSDERTANRFWGYISVTLPFPNLVKAARINELSAEGYGISLQHAFDTLMPATSIYRNTDRDMGDAIVRTYPIPGGGNFQLAITDSTLRKQTRLMVWISLALIATLLFLLTLRLLRRPVELAAEVRKRTQQIENEKVALHNEIASRIKAEEMLEKSHQLLDSIFEHIPGMIILKRASDLRIARVNCSGEEILGRSRDLLLGRCNEEIYPASIADRLSQGDYQAMLDHQAVEHLVERIELLGSSPRWIRYRKVSLRDSSGRPEYILEFGEDITEQERLDQQLREHLNFLEQLIDAIPAPLFFKDAQGRFLGGNRALERFMGISRQDFIGKTIFDIGPQSLALTYHQSDQELLQSGGSQIYEASAFDTRGEERQVMFHKAVFHATSGDMAGIVGIMLDISERKQAETRINQLNRVLTVLSETNRAVVHIHDQEALLCLVASLMRSQGGFPMAWTYLVGQEEPTLFVDDQENLPIIRQMMAAFAAKPRCNNGSAIYCDSVDCCDRSFAATLAHRGLRSFVHLPLLVQGQQRGGICIIDASLEGFSSEERQMLAELSESVAFALESMAVAAEREKAEANLLLAAQVFENSTEGIIISDANNRILMVNRAFAAMTGYSPEEVIGSNPRILSSGRQNASFYQHMWHSLETNDEWHGEIENRRKDGETYPEWLSLSVVRDNEGKVSNYVAVFSDLTKRKEIEQRLNFLAHYDSLTSLPNRTLFHDRISQALAHARKNQSLVAILILDIDRFSRINETIGHSAGDQLLIEVAQRLTGHLPSRDSACRLGGDEFGLILNDIQSPAEAASRAMGICDFLRQPLGLGEHEIHLSLSIGISLFPADAENLDGLVRNADTAMHSAIQNGGNCFRFFQQEMNRRSAERMQLESRLHHALERGELAVHFQPLVCAHTGRIAGAEALLRWHGGEGEARVIPPATFVPLLEETGLIIKVGEWVLRTACEQQQRWQREAGLDLFVAVNLSALQLADNQLLDKVRRIIAETGIRPGDLEIELTESAAMRDADHGIQTMHQLKQLGLRLSIDDFGTGYSSLSYLKQLPLDTLKIDRSFVSEALLDSEAASIIRAIIALGHSLQLEIIAEGIESDAQTVLLRDLSVDLLQGYHFSRPLSSADFLDQLQGQPSYLLPEKTPPLLPEKTIPFPGRQQRRPG